MNRVAGSLLAPPGRFHKAVFEPVPADDLIRVAVGQVEAGLPWVKVIADFPGADMNFFAAPADLVIWEEDPREEPGRLARPVRVLVDGVEWNPSPGPVPALPVIPGDQS